MNRWCSALLVLTIAVLPARAHFIWIMPVSVTEQQTKVKVIFSDTLQADESVPITKIAKTKLTVRDAKGNASTLRWTEGKDAYEATLPGQGPFVVEGVCRYGVVQRGTQEPFLLVYYPTLYVVNDKLALNSGAARDESLLKPSPAEQRPLQMLPVQFPLKYRVLWHGAPLAGAEVVELAPGGDKGGKWKTNAEGFHHLVHHLMAISPVYFGFRASHVEEKEGEFEGKKYKQVRHYATLVVATSAGVKALREKKASAAPAAGVKPPPDPAATKLLADARAARGHWENFPGFSADLEVNFDGAVHKGNALISSEGKVTVKVADAAAAAWAKRLLASTAGHRLDNTTTLHTPCAFADDNAHHPLGRAIRVLNDEFHSSYRIRARQIIEVNRKMGDVRFTITVLHNQENAEHQFLPTDFVVNTWDVKGDTLRSSEAHHQSWRRVGPFDLPATTLVVTATAGSLGARSLTLSNHKLATVLFDAPLQK